MVNSIEQLQQYHSLINRKHQHVVSHTCKSVLYTYIIGSISGLILNGERSTLVASKRYDNIRLWLLKQAALSQAVPLKILKERPWQIVSLVVSYTVDGGCKNCKQKDTREGKFCTVHVMIY